MKIPNTYLMWSTWNKVQCGSPQKIEYQNPDGFVSQLVYQALR